MIIFFYSISSTAFEFTGQRQKKDQPELQPVVCSAVALHWASPSALC
jgi:hypothetical protein